MFDFVTVGLMDDRALRGGLMGLENQDIDNSPLG